jgi:hypothetical protein
LQVGSAAGFTEKKSRCACAWPEHPRLLPRPAISVSTYDDHRIAPGETEKPHHHRLPSIFVVDRLVRLRDFDGSTGEEIPLPIPKEVESPVILKFLPQPLRYVENLDTSPFVWAASSWPIAATRPSRVRAAALRSRCFSLAKTCSMGIEIGRQLPGWADLSPEESDPKSMELNRRRAPQERSLPLTLTLRRRLSSWISTASKKKPPNGAALRNIELSNAYSDGLPHFSISALVCLGWLARISLQAGSEPVLRVSAGDAPGVAVPVACSLAAGVLVSAA